MSKVRIQIPQKKTLKSKKKHVSKGKTTQLLKKREYTEKKWKEREVMKENHFSHVAINFEGDMIEQQKVPGFCILCTNQFHSIKPSIMKYHFKRVHLEHSITVRNKKHLLCKCKYVPVRGSDSTNRNAHFHCLICHKCKGTSWGDAWFSLSGG